MSKSEAKNGFVLYQNYFNQIVLLSMEERGMLFTAIFEYERNGRITVEMPPTVGIAFSFIKDTLDRDREAYVAKCEQNAKNGKKGGRPRKQLLLSKTERFSKDPKKADKETENGNGNEKENENDIDIGKERDWETRADAASFPKEATMPVGSAACVPSPVPSPAPRLSEEEWAFFKEKGIPEAYVTARLERAVKHARNRDRGVVELLLEWWNTDRSRSPWNLQSVGAKERAEILPPSSSFDTDDFFQAALNHSMREMGLEGWNEKGQRI